MFTDCYCTQFRRSANALTRLYDAEFRPIGLRLTQFSLLRAISRLGRATMTEVALEAALDKTTMSRNMRILVRKGWVDVAGSKDGRERVVTLSASGAAMIRRALPYWQGAQKKVESLAKSYFRKPVNPGLLDALESLQRI